MLDNEREEEDDGPRQTMRENVHCRWISEKGTAGRVIRNGKRG